MPEPYESSCTGEQLDILTRNEWKYTQVKGKHIRIHPCRSHIPITPPGPVKCTAEIEELDNADMTWGEADAEARKVVEILFASVL